MKRVGRAVLVASLVTLLAGCLPLPEVRRTLVVEPPSYRMEPASVTGVLATFRGAREPHTPDALNRAYALRFSMAEPPRAVFVLVPGLSGGATSLERLARQLVAATPGLQVWVVERRANALEDRRGFERALRASDPSLALDYYLGTPDAPAAFAPPRDADVRFMAYWGLRVHLEDLAAVVAAAHEVAPSVYLGGHSLGATLAALYAAHELPGGRIGSDTIQGLVLLDGAPGRTGAFGQPDVALGWSILGITVLPSIEALEAGRARPYLLAPQLAIRTQLVYHAAAARPHALADPRLADYRVTNLALAGVLGDGRYAQVPMLASTLGEATGARYAGNLLAFLLAGAPAARNRTIVGPAPGVDHVGWTRGEPPAPTDIRAFVETAVGPDADGSEWYFPTRLLLDMAALDMGLEDAPGFRPVAEVTVPTLAVGAGEGLIRSLDGFAGYANARAGSAFRSYVVPGLRHIDLVNADGAPVVTLFQGWVREAGGPLGGPADGEARTVGFLSYTGTHVGPTVHP